eukprot:1178541-Prorocentrum_minimum.AAC.2
MYPHVETYPHLKRTRARFNLELTSQMDPQVDNTETGAGWWNGARLKPPKSTKVCVLQLTPVSCVGLVSLLLYELRPSVLSGQPVGWMVQGRKSVKGSRPLETPTDLQPITNWDHPQDAENSPQDPQDIFAVRLEHPSPARLANERQTIRRTNPRGIISRIVWCRVA